MALTKPIFMQYLQIMQTMNEPGEYLSICLHVSPLKLFILNTIKIQKAYFNEREGKFFYDCTL
jgi:hypothetical protein